MAETPVYELAGIVQARRERARYEHAIVRTALQNIKPAARLPFQMKRIVRVHRLFRHIPVTLKGEIQIPKSLFKFSCLK